MSELPGFVDPRTLLSRYGLRPKKSFSQNFLVSRHAVERIAAAAELGPGAAVVEIGAGLGTLTAELLRTGARVVAIEPDAELREVLDQELVPCGLELRDGDATTLDYAALAGAAGGPLRVVGNLPYAITGAIIRNLIAQRQYVHSAVLMVQREVRDRLVAAPATRAYGALTVFTTAAFDVETVVHLSPGAFHPAPKVRSSVVRLVPRAEPRAHETEAFRSVVRATFQYRRKTLRNGLARVGSAAQVAGALAAAGIDPGVRGETLSVEQFASLAAAWQLHAPQSED